MTDPTTWPLDKLIRLIDASNELLSTLASDARKDLAARHNAMTREFRARCERGEVPKHLSYCEPNATIVREG